MIVLFIHQNFPGQYKHLVRDFLDRDDSRVLFITQSNNNVIPGVEKIVYDPNLPKTLTCHPFAVDFDHAIRVGLAVREVCRALKAQGIVPDIICGHNGWGEMLFIKDIFPEVPSLAYFEFYYHAEGADVGFDSEFDIHIDPSRLRARNAINLLGFDGSDWGNTPTAWQRSLHPPEFRSRLSILHEGIDTERLKPDLKAWIFLEREGVLLNRETEIITYVARNLEPYRGFHVFMRAAAEILVRRPSARVVVIGGDEVSYGNPLVSGQTHREHMLAELDSRLDRSRIHFLGKVSYDNYVRILQISSAHVYLTYPFVLSWSFLEAMACGCRIIGSDTAPVLEVLRNGENGLATSFFDPLGIADAVEEVLDHPAKGRSLSANARATAVDNYDLRSRQLPLWRALIEDLANYRRPSLFPGSNNVVDV